jgi:hypothetical protein
MVLQEPFVHTEETATVEHVDGYVFAEYELHILPLLAAPQTPDAAQLEQAAEHVL